MTSNQITALTIYREPKHKKQTLINLKNNSVAVLLNFLRLRKKYILLFSGIYFAFFLFICSYISLYPNAYSLVIISYDLFITKRLFVFLLTASLIFSFTIFGRYVISICAIFTALCLALFASAFYSFNLVSNLHLTIGLILLISFSSLICILFYSDSMIIYKLMIGNRPKIRFPNSLYFIFRFIFTISSIDYILFKISNLSMLG